MLTEDARMAMPPWPSWYSGRDAVATFLRGWPLSARKRWRLLPTSANGQPAVAGYLWDEQTTAYRAETIIVLTFRARASRRSPPSVPPPSFRASACPSGGRRFLGQGLPSGCSAYALTFGGLLLLGGQAADLLQA